MGTERSILSILLVDDDPDMCESLADVIDLQTGHKVEYTTSPLKALELIRANDYDIAVIDYKMPEMNGIELLRQIKTLKPDMTVMLLTAFLSERLIGSAEASGAKKVLSKFIWPDEIIREIENALL